MSRGVSCFAGTPKNECDEAESDGKYPKHVRELDKWHIWVVKMDLNHNLELPPSNFLDLKGWFEDFY